MTIFLHHNKAFIFALLESYKNLFDQEHQELLNNFKYLVAY